MIRRRARGVRTVVPAGSLIGRLPATGQGDAGIVNISDLARQQLAQGGIPPSGSPSPLLPITTHTVLANPTGSTAPPIATAFPNPPAGLTWAYGLTTITITLANDLAALEGLSSTGIAARTTTDTWALRTIGGTANRVTLSNGDGVAGNPTVDISAAYAGQASIATLGTVTTGVWQGTAIDVTHGGTGANLSATGGVGQVLKQASAGTTVSVTTFSVTELAGLGAAVSTFLVTPSSANLAAAVTDEIGSGALVFGTGPTLTTVTLTGATAFPNGEIASTGQLLHGSLTTAVSFATVSNQNAQFSNLDSGGTFSPGLAFARLDNTVNGPTFFLGKSRGSKGTPAAVQSGDLLGLFEFDGDDGSTANAFPVRAGQWRTEVDGTVTTSVVPTRMTWRTMNTGGTFAERMRLSSAGGLSVGAVTDAGTQNILAAGTVTANTGGSNLTDQIFDNFNTSTAQLNKVNNTTFTSVTGLSHAVAAGKTYQLHGRLSVTTGVAGGIKVQLAAGGATVTSASISAWAYNTTTMVAASTVTALTTPFIAFTGVVTDILIEGAMVVNAGGTPAIQAAQNAGSAVTTSVFINSLFNMMRTT